MSAQLTDAERAKLAVIVAALEYNGFTSYRPEVLKMIALNVDLTKIDDADLRRVIGEYQERPIPRTLGDRLKHPWRPAELPAEPVVKGDASRMLRPWRMKLAELPQAEKRRLAAKVKSAEFLEEWAYRMNLADDGREKLAKGLAYSPAVLALACAMCLMWEAEAVPAGATAEREPGMEG